VTDKKSTGKSAGGFSKFKQKYGELGGGKRPDSEESEHSDSQPSSSQNIQPSERPDVQPLEHSTIQDAKQLDSQQSKRLDVQPSSHQTIQPLESQDREESSMPNSTVVERPSAQEPESKQQRSKSTVYLDSDLKYWVRQQAIIEEQRRGHHVEISDIINEALRKAKEG